MQRIENTQPFLSVGRMSVSPTFMIVVYKRKVKSAGKATNKTQKIPKHRQ